MASGMISSDSKSTTSEIRVVWQRPKWGWGNLGESFLHPQWFMQMLGLEEQVQKHTLNSGKLSFY